jgi:hypothetical protein
LDGRVNAIVAFMRGFPQTRDTLCSEAVAAWLQARGLAPRISRRAQILTKARHGTDGGANLVADQIGASEIAPADVRDGDIVLVPCAAGNRVLGIHIGKGVTVMAGFGSVHIGNFEVNRAWRLPE